MDIQSVVLNQLETNCWILKQDGQAIVIDPSCDPFGSIEPIIRQLSNVTLAGILLTHGHYDHISGVDALVDYQKAPIYLFHSEMDFLWDKNLNLSFGFDRNFSVQSKVTAISEGSLTVGPLTFEVCLTPGHTKGSVSYILKDKIFCGDAIFRESIGRTDLPTGDERAMFQTIQWFKKLHGNPTLYPGHGPKTTLDHERSYNPFF